MKLSRTALAAATLLSSSLLSSWSDAFLPTPLSSPPPSSLSFTSTTSAKQRRQRRKLSGGPIGGGAAGAAAAAAMGWVGTSLPRSTAGGRNVVCWYEPPQNEPSNSMWNALTTTEQWLAKLAGKAGPNNPYQRKEVSYVCEVLEEDALVVAGLWRRLREAREMGETHGELEVDRQAEEGSKYKPAPFRITQVIVIPNSPTFNDSFFTFDKLVQAVNQARREGRHLVTDLFSVGDHHDPASPPPSPLSDPAAIIARAEQERWSVGVSLAHLHPNFGTKTSEQQLRDMQEEERRGEVDLNLKAHIEKRALARQSPYPTLVVEVRATPPPTWGPPSGGAGSGAAAKNVAAATAAAWAQKNTLGVGTGKEGVTVEDIQRLEALFQKSGNAGGEGGSAFYHDDEGPSSNTVKTDDEFWEAVSNTKGIEEISIMTPMAMAQNWVAERDSRFNATTSTFTVTDGQHVDEVYEFVFTNMAMQVSSSTGDSASASSGMPSIPSSRPRQYLIMTQFVTKSAPSLEIFARSVENVVATLPSLRNKVQMETFHPHHLEKGRRSPVPILVLKWDD